MARIKPTNEAWKDCPRADECSCNDCPLTLKKYKTLENYPMQKCGYGKTGRMRVGKKWGLKNLGLKEQELAGYKKWQSLPEHIKKERIEKLKENLRILRLSKKGYAIVPKKKVISGLQEQNVSNGFKQRSLNEIEVDQ